MNIIKKILIIFLRIAASMSYRSRLYWRQIEVKLRRLIPKRKQNNIVIYTALFGGYDDLKEPPSDIIGCDFVCFTDDVNMRSSVYDVRVSRPISECSNRSAKIFKVLPHKFLPEYSYSIWIDGSITLRGKVVSELITKFLKEHNFAVFRHSLRDCLYDEMEECIRIGNDDIPIMRDQIDKYRKEGYPKNNGLATCTLLIRKHNAKGVREFSDLWYSEIDAGSRRDQLSFNYVEWRTRLRVMYIEKMINDNEYLFKVKHHKTSPTNKNIFSRLIAKLST